MELVILLLILSGYVASVRVPHQVLVSHPGGIGGIFQGPNSETIVKGPDGSLITAEQEGGAVKTEVGPIVVPDEVLVPLVAEEQGLVPLSGADRGVGREAVSATVREPGARLLTAGPVVPIAAPVVPLPVAQSAVLGLREQHIIQKEIVHAPEVEPDENAELWGPSGTIPTRGSSSLVSGPASITISESLESIPAPVVQAVPLVALTPGPTVEIRQDLSLSTPAPPLRLIPTGLPPSPSQVWSTGAVEIQQAVPQAVTPTPIRPVPAAPLWVQKQLALAAAQARAPALGATSLSARPVIGSTLSPLLDNRVVPQSAEYEVRENIPLPETLPPITRENLKAVPLPSPIRSLSPTSSDFGANIRASISSAPGTGGYQQNIEFGGTRPIKSRLLSRPESIGSNAAIAASSTLGSAGYGSIERVSESSTLVPSLGNQVLTNNRQLTTDPLNRQNTIPSELVSLQRGIIDPGVNPLNLNSQNIIPSEIRRFQVLSKGVVNTNGNPLNVNPQNIIPSEIRSLPPQPNEEVYPGANLLIVNPQNQIPPQIRRLQALSRGVIDPSGNQLNVNPQNIIPQEISRLPSQPSEVIDPGVNPLNVNPQIIIPPEIRRLQALSKGVIDPSDNQLNVNPQNIIPTRRLPPQPNEILHSGVNPLNVNPQNIIPPEIRRLPPLPKRLLGPGVDPLNVNPQNIIRPELRRLPPLPKGVVDLGTTVTVRTVTNPLSEASTSQGSINQNLNGLDVEVRNIEGKQPNIGGRRLAILKRQRTNQGQVIRDQTINRVPLAAGLVPKTQANGLPVINNPIRQDGVVNYQLGQQGLNPTQINFERVPLSSVIQVGRTASSDYDGYEDTGLELANRYDKQEYR